MKLSLIIMIFLTVFMVGCGDSNNTVQVDSPQPNVQEDSSRPPKVPNI